MGIKIDLVLDFYFIVTTDERYWVSGLDVFDDWNYLVLEVCLVLFKPTPYHS